MGVRTKGGMRCPSCDRPIMAVKTTHRARNTMSGLLLPFTGGLSVFGFRVERYVCPYCGHQAAREPLSPAGRMIVLAVTVAAAISVAAASWHDAVPILIVGAAYTAYQWRRHPEAAAIVRRFLHDHDSTAAATCPGCGGDVAAGAVRCRHCGTLLT